MKRNAIFRIVIYVVVIMVLLAILFTVMFGMSTKQHNRVEMAATEVIVETTSPRSLLETMVATATVNVRRSPSSEAEAVSHLQAGEVVRVGRQELVNGRLWAYVVEPVSGWVVAEYLGEAAPQETGVSVQLPEPGETGNEESNELQETMIAQSDVNIRSTPSVESENLGMLHAEDVVRIGRKETVNGLDWAYVTYPTHGWVMAKYLSDYIPQETGVSVQLPEPGEKSSFHASEISEIEIEWVAGDILIQPGTSDQITIDEDGNFDEKYAMVLKQQGKELKISFCQEAVGNYFGISTRTDVSKDLTITVPMDWICESLEIDAASATVEVNDLTIREVSFDGASGACEFENCIVDEIDIDTASGDVTFVGELKTLDCDGASASVYAVLNNVPSRLDLDVMSGDLDITLPENAGFSLRMDAMSDNFTSDFDTTMKNGNYVCGDGACRINIDALSGDVTIRKADKT